MVLFSTWIQNIAISSGESLNNARVSRLRDVGVTEKHIERCEKMSHGIFNEFYLTVYFSILLKYIVFPYIIDGAYIREIIKKLFSSNCDSNGDSSGDGYFFIFLSLHVLVILLIILYNMHT